MAEGAARLMVIIPDRLSDLLAKGEFTDRYYNPGDVFDEVHLVLVNDDHPSTERLQPLVGRARLHVHNLPDPRLPLFVATLGWRPALLRIWARRAVRLAERVRPDLIRCHAAQLNAFAAAEINRVLGIPYVLSLHINPDWDLLNHPHGGDPLPRRAVLAARRSIERIALRRAAAVVCVYRFIEPFARAGGARRIEQIYNVVSPSGITAKADYALGDPPTLVIPGRQFHRKDPRPVLDALVNLPGVHCHLIGDGELHETLLAHAIAVGVADRTTFIRAVPNDELVAGLHRYDVLVSPNDYGGVSKVEIEAAHVGMPIITNAHPYEDEPELLGPNCVVVDGSAESYERAIRELLADEDHRRRIGTALRESTRWMRSEATEAAYADLYRSVLSDTSS